MALHVGHESTEVASFRVSFVPLWQLLISRLVISMNFAGIQQDMPRQQGPRHAIHLFVCRSLI